MTGSSFWYRLLLLLPFLMGGVEIVGCNVGNIERSVIAPQSGEASPETLPCRNVPHDAGVTEICNRPERVVALDPHAMDLLLSLDIQPIGYAEVDVALVHPFATGDAMNEVKYLGDRLTKSPTFIGTRSQPSLEAILALKPDLIVGEDADSSSYSALSQIAPTILLRGTEADQWKSNIQRLSKAFNSEAIAWDVIAAHIQKIQQAKAKLAPIVTQKRTLLVSTDGSSFSVFHDQNDYAGSLLRDLGFSLITVGDNRYPNVSLEVLPQLKADFIFVMTSSDNTVEDERARWAQQPILRSLSAYQNNQVYFVDYQLWSRIRGPIVAELILDEIQTLLLPDND
jgi:iron complex transport system substrate-binding protein